MRCAADTMSSRRQGREDAASAVPSSRPQLSTSGPAPVTAPPDAGRSREVLGHHDPHPQRPQGPGNSRPAGRLVRNQFEVVFAIFRKTGESARARLRRAALATDDAVDAQPEMRRRPVHAGEAGDAVRAGFVHGPGEDNAVGPGLGGQPGEQARPVLRRGRPGEAERRQSEQAGRRAAKRVRGGRQARKDVARGRPWGRRRGGGKEDGARRSPEGVQADGSSAGGMRKVRRTGRSRRSTRAKRGAPAQIIASARVRAVKSEVCICRTPQSEPTDSHAAATGSPSPGRACRGHATLYKIICEIIICTCINLI